ncbi:MAG TPA: ATP-binding protein [Chloroflexia bacterium]|nr:ATP-binding protein [Chloroflexia bacterium]
MAQPIVLIISGPPCTGKTTLGQRLAHDLRLPFLSKDRIKELLFDTLGVGDREWSKKLGAATMELLFMLAETELAAGRSFLLEANFRPALANRQFMALKEKYDFRALQVECRADSDVLLARFKARTESGERHPGHIDHVTYPEVVADLLEGVYGPLEVADTVYAVDTTDFARVNYAQLLEKLREAQLVR